MPARRHTTILRLGLLLCCLLASMSAIAGINVSIKLEGLDEAQRKNVLEFLSIQQEKDHPLLSAALVRRLHAKAAGEIRRALEPLGYYQAQVESEFKEDPQGIQLTYRVKPGPPVIISRLDLQISGAGKDDPDFRQQIRDLPLAVGEVLQHARYEDAKAQLQKAAAELGYLEASFARHRVEVDRVKNRAEVELAFDTGPRYRFGEVRFMQDILDPEFLSRFSPVAEGDAYSLDALLKLQKALSDSGYFSRVDVNPRQDQAQDQTIPVDVKLVPRKRNLYTLGGGYGTDTGIRGKAGWENRRINKRGHQLAVNLLAAEIKNNQTLRYTIPLKFYQADQLAITASRDHEWLEDSEQLVRSVAVSRSLGRELWRRTIALTYSAEDFVVGSQRNATSLLMPSISLTRIDTDNRLNASRGTRLILDLRGARRELISETNFAQLQLQAKHIHTLTPSTRLILRGRLGVTNAAEFDRLPNSLRFYSGGDNSVRGYRYKSIAPRDANGDLTGAEHVLEASIEAERHMHNNWSAALFFDAGNAFNSIEAPGPLQRGTGLGLRWQSPIGPIRFDLAWALDRDGTPWRLHFTVGPDL